MPAPGQPPIHKNVAKLFWAHKPPVAVKSKKPNIITRTAMNYVSKKLLPFLLNWKTTLAGLALILHGCSAIVQALINVTEGTSLTLDSLQLAVGEIIAGAGLIAARDANKSSWDSQVR
tara:strand:+ start:1177 stop:1530 length:354 start_codon:yes stop_codon:yes gene_type:complete